MNYKGMKMDMTCQGFQFEQGKEYEHPGPVKCCPDEDDLQKGIGGFHACEYPLDVFNYYAPANSRFFEVEQSGEMDKRGGDTIISVCSAIVDGKSIKADTYYTVKNGEFVEAE